MHMYKVLSTLGSGSQACVRLAMVATTGELVALKTVRRSRRLSLSRRGQLVDDVGTELAFRRRLEAFKDHPAQRHIVRLLDHFCSDKQHYLAYEYCPGLDLEHQLTERGGCLAEAEARYVVEVLLHTLSFIHSAGCVHRDLKPSNILVRDPHRIAETLALADFGASFVADDDSADHPEDRWERPPSPPGSGGSPISATGMMTLTGTPFFLAPELVRGQPYDAGADIWSLGVTCFRILFGYTPFSSAPTFEELYAKIDRAEVAIPDGLVSREAVDFLRGLLHPDPRLRATADTALKHPWILGQPFSIGRVLHLNTPHVFPQAPLLLQQDMRMSASASTSGEEHVDPTEDLEGSGYFVTLNERGELVLACSNSPSGKCKRTDSGVVC